MRGNDEYWMNKALSLATKYAGKTSPNPSVGAFVVKNGEFVSYGFHAGAGKDHAEVMAIKQAGDKTRGAVLYVTLEPCSTYGRTPPCTDAIIKAGFKTVVYAIKDPNPKHKGKGVDILIKSGIKVKGGVCKDKAWEVIREFAKYITEQIPFVTLKLAISFDGRIADSSGGYKWISSERSRLVVKKIRGKVDAIIVGSGTLQNDNPSLLPQDTAGKIPYRVVLAGKRRIPSELKLFTDDFKDKTMVFTSNEYLKFHKNLEKAGIKIQVVPSQEDSFPDICMVLRKLGDIGCMHVLCEGGGKLAGQFLRKNMIDELLLFVSNKVIGEFGVPAVKDIDYRVTDPPSFYWSSVRKIGDDVLLKGISYKIKELKEKCLQD